jgi:ribosomal protein S18 acetylase RimI-like enzyme
MGGDALHCRPLLGRDLPGAVELLAAALGDNPLYRSVFGEAGSRRRQRVAGMFRATLPGLMRRGMVLAADRGGELAGVAAALPPGGCIPERLEHLRSIRTHLHPGDPPPPLLQRWQFHWAARDPAAPHWHVGPVAVAPAWQREGIGTALIDRLAARIDRDRAPAYLETDTTGNVRFYRRLGFEVAGTGVVGGVPDWFLVRNPA